AAPTHGRELEAFLLMLYWRRDSERARLEARPNDHPITCRSCSTRESAPGESGPPVSEELCSTASCHHIRALTLPTRFDRVGFFFDRSAQVERPGRYPARGLIRNGSNFRRSSWRHRHGGPAVHRI